MINDKISGKQFVNIMIVFTMGSSLVTGGCMKAKQDSWIGLLIAVALAVPAMFLFARINELAPKKNIYDLSYILYGKVGGAILTFLFSFFALSLGTLVIRNFTEYIQVVALAETPKIVNAICMGVIAYLTVRCGIEILGRGNVFVLPIVLGAILFTVVLSYKDADYMNLLPVLEHKKNIIECSTNMLAFPFLETVVFLAIFPFVETKTKPVKLYLISLAIASFMILILMIRNMLVLGFPLAESIYFPTYTTTGIIQIKEIITRIEVIISASFIILGLVKVSICLFACCKGYAKLFNIGNYRKTSIPLILIMVLASGPIYKSTMQMFNLVSNYKYYSWIFELLIPIIIWIPLEIKVRKHKLHFDDCEQMSKTMEKMAASE